LAQFAKDLLIRLAVAVAFAAATSRVIKMGTVERYRVTGTSPQTITDEDIPPVELQDAREIPQPQ